LFVFALRATPSVNKATPFYTITLLALHNCGVTFSAEQLVLTWNFQQQQGANALILYEAVPLLSTVFDGGGSKVLGECFGGRASNPGGCADCF